MFKCIRARKAAIGPILKHIVLIIIKPTPSSIEYIEKQCFKFRTNRTISHNGGKLIHLHYLIFTTPFNKQQNTIGNLPGYLFQADTSRWRIYISLGSRFDARPERHKGFCSQNVYCKAMYAATCRRKRSLWEYIGVWVEFTSSTNGVCRIRG